MTQSSISTLPVTNNIAKTPTVQEVDGAWKKYTAPGSDGQIQYYYNALLKECTYRKPDVLKKKEQAMNDPPPDSRKC